MKFLLIFITTFLIGFTSPLLGQVKFVPVLEESKLWIEGTANPVDFVCTAENLSGFGLVGSNNSADPDITISRSENDTDIEVRIPVRRMECGRERMNRDFRNALRSELYEDIIFKFISATHSNDNTNSVTFLVTGNLTVAGVTREVEIPVHGEQIDINSFRLKGEREIKMTDYDVEPPTAMMGLIRARNELTVHFDILVEPES